ncbi:GntR family transcriptional regulator [Clostridiaceae bacterium UIB06]|uniref:GntR family transcriptional regulator n=1 Tax=Clostridium thailandense TaxID=2794346 RepID=A0A949TSS7_9CLOT|nr:GntR family transcriptional regulator [Clostridium thailandense]MBV7274692.1 GntR family transcriptional regulator [Clostridium thailandense]MCH5137397.1 GntR family transcriptional regulator [Clostridiaceae bacterium UIB06]
MKSYKIYNASMMINIDKNLRSELTRRKTTPTIVADILRTAILKGELKGGQQLIQADIAEQFGMSRIPVREALKQLEMEGLVKQYPNKGAVISELSADEVQEIYEIRSLLETGAIKLSIENLSEEDLEQAENLLKEIDRAEDVNKWIELNWEFHSCLYAPANRPRLLSIVNNLHINVGRYIRIYLGMMNFEEKSQEEHYKILNACKEGNAQEAANLIEEHLKNVSMTLVSYLNERNK